MATRENRPGTVTEAAPKTSATTQQVQRQSSVNRPEDGYAAPTVDDRHEAKLLDELRALGYGITMPCQACGHPLSNERSLARHIGPKCAAKAVR